MSPAQKQLYFRAVKTAMQAQGWTSVADCRAALAAYDSGQSPMWESPTLDKIRVDVLETAALRSEEQRRELTPEDLRHAVTEVALGRNVSSKKFTNADLDKILTLLRLLADPTNLKNIMAFEAGGAAGERKRHVHVITRARESYWQRIARDKFGHTDLDRLTLAELRQLSLTIRTRLKNKDENRQSEAETRTPGDPASSFNLQPSSLPPQTPELAAA